MGRGPTVGSSLWTASRPSDHWRLVWSGGLWLVCGLACRLSEWMGWLGGSWLSTRSPWMLDADAEAAGAEQEMEGFPSHARQSAPGHLAFVGQMTDCLGENPGGILGTAQANPCCWLTPTGP